jgi:hypothetical protein
MLLLAMHPVEMWLTVRRLEEDMIYRLLFCSLLGTFGATLLSAAMISEHIHRLLDRRSQANTFLWSLLDRVYSFRGLGLAAAMVAPTVAWLIGHGGWTWLTDGFITEHWSRAVLAGLLVFILGELGLTTLVVNILRFHTARASAEPTRAVVRSLPAAGIELPVPITAPAPVGEPLVF